MISVVKTLNELKKEDFSILLNEKYIISLQRNHKFYSFIKRTLDIVLSMLGLILLSPLFVMLWIIVALDIKGNPIFAHRRIGLNGNQFTMYKFRTMHTDVDKQARAPITAKDDRITKLGRFLRRTSLDELPQLINILKGEMSVIGPRPEMPFIVKTYNRLQRSRLLVKPGLTGLWQISGRKDLPLHENLEFDLYYIKNRSLILDLIIFFKTFIVIFSGKGAY